MNATIPDTVWTTNTRVFQNMKTEDVLHNYKMYLRYVNHPAFLSERESLQKGMFLCQTELEKRNFIMSERITA